MLAKTFFRFVCLTVIISALFACHSSSSKSVKIGVVVPIEHKAIQAIVAGLTEYLHNNYPEVIIQIKNAQGDANLQRAILQQMRDENYQVIVPISTTTTQMALSIINEQPVVSMASKLNDRDRKQYTPCHAVFVHDEIPPEQLIAFIHSAYPHIKVLTLVHSSSEKVLPDVQSAIIAGAHLGIDVKHLMISSLPELYAAGKAIPENTQAIFILKDNLIASGINTLARIAHEKNIPIIASDEGSVHNGADMALGVFEKQIGIEGAKLVMAVLSGKSACSLPIVDMKKLTVFMNPHAQNSKEIIFAAKQAGYAISLTTESQS